MTTSACRDLPLVEALRDGRLAPQDRASAERHIASCADCRGYARELERIGEVMKAPLPQASELEHQRARRALLSKAMTPERRASGSYRQLAFAAVMLLVAVGSGLGFSRLDRRATEKAVAALRMHVPGVKAPLPRETTIQASRGARYEHATDQAVESIALKTGVLDVRVRPLEKGERFVVKTDDAEIDVRGTAFRVSAEDGKIRDVSVVEGSVEVRYAGFTAIIPSGGSWRASSDAAPSSAPVGVAPSAPSSAALAAAPAPAASSHAASSGHDSASVAVGSRASKVSEPSPKAPEPAPVASVEAPAKKELSAASRAFADAMDALARGDDELAADRFGTFSRSFASDPRADEADYLRAVALQRAGHAGDAKAASKKYLEARPNGAHRGDAKTLSGP